MTYSSLCTESSTASWGFDAQAPRSIPSLLEQDGRSLVRLVTLIQHLLSPDGCPWDRVQTPLSLRRYLHEEACEVLDALDAGDAKNLCEELGDLLFQIVFLAELARREGTFALDDVIESIVSKMIRRHPHVFGEEQLETEEQLRASWERIKQAEAPHKDRWKLAPDNFPALARAQRMVKRCLQAGRNDLLSLGEGSPSLDGPVNPLGDELLRLVMRAEESGVDAEEALHRAVNAWGGRLRTACPEGIPKLVSSHKAE